MSTSATKQRTPPALDGQWRITAFTRRVSTPPLRVQACDANGKFQMIW